MRFFASCSKGLEYLLADELQALGCARATAAVAGVQAEGDLHAAQRAVLWSRLASRVLWPLAEFECDHADALYRGVRTVDWTRHLSPDLTLAVDAHGSAPGIDHSGFAAQRVKDAVVDVLREATGQRPSVDVVSPDLRLNLLLRKGRAILAVDLGGGALHRRGWRGQAVDAPLKETLAAAVLTRGGWPARYADGGALCDPMCGSGTLVIEAALMAADVAPGLQRHGDGLPSRWSGFDVAHWQSQLGEARQRAERGMAGLRPVFFGSDRDPRAIDAARRNAAATGLGDRIQWQVADVDALAALPQTRGLIVCNPPYDARLAADPALYRRLGDALRRAAVGWTASLLCGDEALALATGLHARKRYTVFNGALECSLILVDTIEPPRTADAPLRPLSDGAQMVANRLQKNLRKLSGWRQREQIDCFRAYDADLPEYAAAIDVYTEADNGRTWLHVQEYAAPASIPEAVASGRLRDLLAAARQVFAVPQDRVAVKTRSSSKGGSQYGRFARSGEVISVREGAARLRVNLFDYLDTGLFLDHRPTRLRIAGQARDARFLNLFCYTGAATVQAALGGAAQTTSVDLSATYLEWLADNLRENGLGGTRHSITQADVLAWLRADSGRYDLIFCDPPTFSNSARAADFDVQRDHVALLRLAMARLAPQGLLLFSNNYRRFRLDDTALAAFARVEEVGARSIPPDFARNARIHRCWELRHPAA